MSRLSLADAGYNVVRPTQAQQQQDKMDAAERSSLSSLGNLFSSKTIGSAYQLTPTAMLAWFGEGAGYEPDPYFALTPEKIDDFLDGIDPSYAPLMTGAYSDQHLAFLKERARAHSGNRKTLADAGWGGSVASIGASFIEPVNLSSMLAGNFAAAAAPLATAAQVNRGSRVLRAIEYGLIQAGTSAGAEGFRNVVDPTADAGASVANVFSDFALGGVGGGLADQARFVRALAGGAGSATPQMVNIAMDDDMRAEEASSALFFSLVLGGGFSAIAPKTSLDGKILNAAVEFDKKVTANTITSMNLPLTRKGRATLGQYMPDLATERANAQVAQMAGLEGPPRPVAEGTTLPAGYIEPTVEYVPTDPYTKTQVGATNVGAAAGQAPKPINPKYDIFDFSNIHDGSTRFVGSVKGVPTVRFDMGALAGQSEISEYRALNNIFSTDPVSRIDKATGVERVAPFSLMESVTAHTNAVFQGEYMQAMKPAWEEWINELGKQGVTNMGARLWGDASPDAFARAVSDGIETLAAGGTVSSPAMMKAINATTKLFEDQWGLMHHHKVEGVDSPQAPIPYYVPHRVKRHAMDQLIAKHDGNIKELTDAIATQVLRPNLKARGNQTAADLDTLADVMARAWVEKGGMPGVEDAFIHGISSSQADDLIDELKLTSADAAAVRAYVAPEGGGPSFLHQRIPFNGLQSFTTSKGTFRMKDVLERNIITLAGSYVRRSTGQAAVSAAQPVFQKMYGSEARIDSPRAFSGLLQKIASDRQTKRGIQPEDANIARLETAYKAVSGLPLWTAKPGSAKDAWGSIVRSVINMNFFRLMTGPRAALNPIQDFAGAMIGPDGTTGAVRRFFPDVFSVVEKARKGQRPDAALIRTMNEMGLGVRGNSFLSGIRDTDGTYNPTLQRIEDITGTLARAGSRVSLQDIGQDFSERMTWNREAQSFYDAAKAGRPLGKKRLFQDGVTEAQAKVIQEQIAKHAIVRDGILVDENFNSWTVPVAAVQYRLMLARRTRRMLNIGDNTMQPNSIAGIPAGSPANRMVAQFRRFPLLAQTNKIAAGVDRGAAYMGALAVSGSASAVLSYTVGVYLDSIGRPDQQEYLDRMLADEMIAKSAFGRAAWSGLLPAYTDTLIALSDNKPIFAPTRVSGLGQDNGALSLWTQNPTGDWFASALGSLAALRSPIDSNYDFSQRNVQAISGALWVPKAAGISNFLRAAGSGLPERSKENP